MENETTQAKQGLLEPVLPGSVTFDERILAPLRNNYLYQDSREYFTYNSAQLINNPALQKRYATFRAEKLEKGYSEQELEESFGFLLFNDENKARIVGETGLLVGQAKCTTLGDFSKGVYISKYSDCLDLKRWYDGKTGYIVLFKLTKGRVKAVTDNYTQNFTLPSASFDCHVSDQIGAVTSTTSSFLAYERTQYYMYEFADGTSETETRPRHTCPFAIVAFSYGKTSTTLDLEEKSQRKTVFHYKPWTGQFKIESTVYDVGLESVNGALFPAKLPKLVKIDHAIDVSELKKTLPREIFETCIVGEVCIDGRCFNLYDVVSSEAKNDLAQITQELKEKDMAFVIPLDGSGFLILLHSSHLFSYEDARSGKAAALQGMFIFPDSRAVPRDTKCGQQKSKMSTDIMEVIPAINYAETEMKKYPSNQKGAPHTVLEKHLQNYATLIHPGLMDNPTREASMFPDQYDVPGGFTLIAPKWSQETGIQLISYFDEPCGFTIPVGRALELLAAGRQQRVDDHDDDVYYCISSPEEVPQTPADAHLDMEAPEQTKAISGGHSASDVVVQKVENLKNEGQHLSTEQPQPDLTEELGTLGTADCVLENPIRTVSPKLGGVPTEHCVSNCTDVEKTTQQQVSTEQCNGVVEDLSSQETLIQTSSTLLTLSVEGSGTASSGGMENNNHPDNTKADSIKKVDGRSLPRRRGRKPKRHCKAIQVKKDIQKEPVLPTSSLPLTLPVNFTEAIIVDPTNDQTDSHSRTETVPANNINQRPQSSSRGRGRRQKGVNQNLSKVTQEQSPFKTTAIPTSVLDETFHNQSMTNETPSPSKGGWRSLPRHRGRKPKRHCKAIQVKKDIQKEPVLPTSSLPLTLPVNFAEAIIVDPTNDQTDSHSRTETVPAININQRPQSSSRGRGRRQKGVNQNLSKVTQEQSPFKTTAIPTSVLDETFHNQSMTNETLSHSKGGWRSLPRRKRSWNSDINLKRSLRSDAVKSGDNDPRLDATEGSLSCAPKRKMDGLSMRERYGLKTIITNCGRVFVPHGSDVACEDVETSNKVQNDSTIEKIFVETSIDTNAQIISPMEIKSTERVESWGAFPLMAKVEYPSKDLVVCEGEDRPSKDKPCVQQVSPITTLGKQNKDSPSEIVKFQHLSPKQSELMNTTLNEALCLQDTIKDQSVAFQTNEATRLPTVPDQSVHSQLNVSSPEKIKKKAKHVYSAISISKLKTVLRKGKRTKSTSPSDNGVSEPDNTEPESKKGKPGFIMDLMLDNNSNKELKDKGSQSINDPMRAFERNIQTVSWRGLIAEASKENGSHNFDTSAPFEIVKQADQQLISSLIGEGVGRTRISSDGNGSTEKLTTGTALPSDALSLLADLALGASNNKMFSNLEAKPGQETAAGLKGTGSPESVLHALLRCPSNRFKPPRSPFPEGLVVTGELILEISKEHSYSQPTSLLSGLSGTCLQVSSPAGSVESPLSLKTGLHLNLPRDTAANFYQEERDKTEWKHLLVPSTLKMKKRGYKIFRNRRIIEKEGSVQVMRIWRETYEFKYDNRFTNDNLEKTVSRALHGKWNFDIEDTFEEVHLIFHMWIGLFYSKSTSRLFLLDSSTALPKRKETANVQQDINPIQSPSLLSVELSSNEDQAQALPLSSDILDLSVKNCEPVNLHPVTKQSKEDNIALHSGVISCHKHEIAPTHFSSGTKDTSIPTLTALTNYRSVHIPVENSIPDKDDTDEENYVIADFSYSQHLETNSAFNQLCEQASNMSIGIQPHLQIAKLINVSKHLQPIIFTASNENDMFHREVCPIKPAVFSKQHSLVLDRKCFDQSFKKKTGNGAPVVLQQEPVSENAESKVLLEADKSQDGCPVTVSDGNVDKTIAFQTEDAAPVLVQNENISEMEDTKEVSGEDCQTSTLAIVEDENVEENITSKSSSRDQASFAEHHETAHVKGELKPLVDEKDHTNAIDHHVEELREVSSHKIGIEKHIETVNAKEDLLPLLDVTDNANVVDASSHVVEGNNAKDPSEERNESYTGEQEDQSKSKESIKLDGDDSESAISTTMAEHKVEFVLGLKDDTNNVDMEVCDKDSDDKAQIEAYENNNSSVKSFVAEPIICAFINEDHDVKIQNNETEPETQVVFHEEVNPGDDAYEETSTVSSLGDMSSLTSHLMSVQEQHTSTSNNETADVIQNGSENITLKQGIVMQQEALDICKAEPKPTNDTEPSKLDVSHTEKDEKSDLEEQDLTETVSGDDDTLVNDNETQSQMSHCCKDKTEVISMHQKGVSPKVCASLHNSTNIYCNEMIALTMNKTSEVGVNSICSTPDQEEFLYDPEVNEGFRKVSNLKEDLNKDLFSDNTDHDVTMLSPKSLVSPYTHVFSKLPFSDFIENSEETEEPGWKSSQYCGTMNFTDNSTSLQKDEEYSSFTEGAPQNYSERLYRDNVEEDLHGYYYECPSDQGFLWPDCKTDGPDSCQTYPYDKDSKGDSYPPICSLYSTSELREDSNRPKKLTEKVMSNFWGAKKKSNQTPEKRPRKSKFTGAFCRNAEWDEDASIDIPDYSIRKTCFETHRIRPITVTVNNNLPHDRGSKERFDWCRYFRREAASRKLFDSSEGKKIFDIPPSSIVTILDKKGNRVTFDNSHTLKQSGAISMKPGLENSFNQWQNQQRKADVTQSAVDLEYLIFSEKLNRILKESKSSPSTTSHSRSNTYLPKFPMTIRFSNFDELVSSTELSKPHPALTGLKIKVEMSDRKVIREPARNNKPLNLQRLFYKKGNEVECSRISEIAEQCDFSYKSMMNDVCSGKTLCRQTEAIKKKRNQESVNQRPGFCGRIKKDMFDNLHDNLNSIVRQACNIKYRFYILVTSKDPFFEETKNILEIEGHIPVEPDEFDLNGNCQFPLLIVLRNEDILEHVCEVPYLLELKKSSSVLFAAIDRPDDVVNLTHQELFAKGGFIVCDETALDTLCLDNMKKVVTILEELDKKGKWKWFLHYRDSRKLRESARSCPESRKKQQFIDCCQEAGIVEVLPYHDCDVISRDRPDYLFCVTRLQIQNATIRFPVFITDTPADSFGKNGILTMNVWTFSRILSNDTCSVS
ncbi:uncharacterized protein LOC127630954 isoform X2 [Xyrauchen texanus]|uniref:uncharacterized protein LOC127630954 isoform X2 n=1 Tax=Xyrauchen texanus TaxID=154827 RepID=UPI00224219FB|nr:uncharacterized protein LOC127630954 isoform X2 [Xyrauchen texanus]